MFCSDTVFTTIYNRILIGIVVGLSGDFHSRACCLQTKTEFLSFRASEMVLSSDSSSDVPGIHELHATWTGYHMTILFGSAKAL